MEEKYTIKCNKEQMLTIAYALDQYSRMICGQLSMNHLPSLQIALEQEEEYTDDYIKKSKMVDNKLAEVKKIIWNMTEGSHVIGYNEKANISYDIYKSIMHHFEIIEEKECIKNNKKYHCNVYSSPPFATSKQLLPKIETLTIRQQKLDKINEKE